jgi:hypothetical protein
MTSTIPVLVSLLLAGAATSTLAQVDSAFWAGLPPGRRLKIEAAGAGRLEARLQAADSAAVRLRAVLRPTLERAVFADTSIAHQAVSGVWVQDGTHWRRGAVIGAAVTAVFVAAVMVTFWGDNDVPFDESRAPLSFAAGVAVGGLLGAGGGLFVMRWRRVWPR